MRAGPEWTSSPGAEEAKAAMVNYGLITSEVVTREEITNRMHEIAAVPAK